VAKNVSEGERKREREGETNKGNRRKECVNK